MRHRQVACRQQAQREYAKKGFAGEGVYAPRFISQPGEKDGLYWPAQSGEDESPLGEVAAAAAAEGYPIDGQRKPYHGYNFRFSTRQGPNAPGGEIDYMVRGNMVGGSRSWPIRRSTAIPA